MFVLDEICNTSIAELALKVQWIYIAMQQQQTAKAQRKKKTISISRKRKREREKQSDKLEQIYDLFPCLQ